MQGKHITLCKVPAHMGNKGFRCNHNGEMVKESMIFMLIYKSYLEKLWTRKTNEVLQRESTMKRMANNVGNKRWVSYSHKCLWYWVNKGTGMVTSRLL